MHRIENPVAWDGARVVGWRGMVKDGQGRPGRKGPLSTLRGRVHLRATVFFVWWPTVPRVLDRPESPRPSCESWATHTNLRLCL